MSRRLDDTSRDILEFRPNIEFVEPEVQEGPIIPVSEPTNLQNVVKEADETRKLAKAVDTLAAALQAKADLRAKDMVVNLDPKVDAPTISSMRRLHPGADPTKITYPQYAQCKENQRKKGLDLGKQGLVTPEQVEKARAALDGTTGFDAGFNSEAAKTGGFRPEVNPDNQIIEPIEMEEFQDNLLRMLVNFLWKSFIKPVIPIPPGVPALPEEIAPVPENVSQEGFLKQLEEVTDKAQEQSKNIPTKENALAAASAEAGNLKASAQTGDPGNLEGFALPPSPANPLALQDCYTVTRTFERAAAYSTTEESVFALLRPSLTNMRIMAGVYEEQARGNAALLENSIDFNPSADQDTTGGDDALSTNSNLVGLVEGDGPGAKKRQNAVGVIANWLSDCFPCSFTIPSAGDFFVKFYSNLKEVGAYYEAWFKHMLDQLAAIANLWNVDSKFREICALIDFFKNFVCLPDLRRIIVILMLLLMRIAFEINGLFDFILALVVPLVLPFLAGIVDTVEKFLLAIVKPIECIIDSIINIVEKLDYNAIFQKGNIRDLAVDVGPQGREFKSDGIGIKAKWPRKRIDANGFEIDILGVEAGYSGFELPRPGDVEASTGPRVYAGANVGVSFNFIEDAPFIGDHMAEEEQAVREAQNALDEIRNRRSEVDFEDETERQAYLNELEQARQARNKAVDNRDFTGGQQLRGFLEGFKKDMRSVMITLAGYLREAINAVEGFVASLLDEFKKLMASFLGEGDSVIMLDFKKLEIIKLISMVTSFIVWLLNGASCSEGDQEDIDTSVFLPQNNEARTIVVEDDGTIRIEERPDLIELAINNVAATIGGEPYDPENLLPGAEVIGTPADRSRQKLNSLIEFTGNPTLDTEIARIVDTITTPAQDIFRCPLQTSVAEAEKVNKWMEELNVT